MVGIILISDMVDISAYFFKLSQVMACSSRITFTELKHFILLFPFLQYIKWLFKKRKEITGYLSK